MSIGKAGCQVGSVGGILKKLRLYLQTATWNDNLSCQPNDAVIVKFVSRKIKRSIKQITVVFASVA